MKVLLSFFCLMLLLQQTSAQSLDYISVKKKNGRIEKNFYAGSDILLQTIDGSYVQGPIRAIRNDSIFIAFYDIRMLPTTLGTFIKDTITIQIIPIAHSDISRIYLSKKKSFLKRLVAPLLMIGGAGYIVLNVVNGAILDQPITSSENVRKLGIAAGAFALGFLLNKLFASDGFSTQKHKIVFVDL